MKYSEEQKEFLFSYIPGHYRKEIRDEFNRRFPDTPITVMQVKGFIQRNHVTTGFDGRFQKGNPPRNKGKKMTAEQYEKLRRTMFKKGQIPHNKKPVGSTRLNVEGYIEIKVAEPNKYVLEQRYVWEQAHGPIPKNYVLLHRNGVKHDNRLENLMLLSKSELIRLNQSGLYSDNQEINEVAINLAKLSSLIGQRKRRFKKAGANV